MADAGKDWKIEGKRIRGCQRMRWLDSLFDSMGINLTKLWKIVEDREVWHAAVHGVTRSLTRLSDLATTTTHTHTHIYNKARTVNYVISRKV